MTNKKSNVVHILIWINIILMIGLSASVIINSYDIKDLKKDIDNTPKCRIEEEKFVVMLNIKDNYAYTLEDNEEIDCETGLSVYPDLRIVVNWENITKYCIVTKKEKTCEIL